jgi:hypothetical protein
MNNLGGLAWASSVIPLSQFRPQKGKGYVIVLLAMGWGNIGNMICPFEGLSRVIWLKHARGHRIY